MCMGKMTCEVYLCTERLCYEELVNGTWVDWLNQAFGAHLDPLELDALITDGFTHLDGVACTTFTVGYEETQQV